MIFGMRSAIDRPRRSAIPYSVTITHASLRGTVTGPDTRVTIRLCRPAVDGNATTGTPPTSLRRTQKIADAAHRTDIRVADRFGVDLAREVHLHRRIDRDEAIDPAQHVGIVRVFRAAQLDRRIAVRETARAR